MLTPPESVIAARPSDGISERTVAKSAGMACASHEAVDAAAEPSTLPS